jgi:hypothetical protein
MAAPLAVVSARSEEREAGRVAACLAAAGWEVALLAPPSGASGGGGGADGPSTSVAGAGGGGGGGRGGALELSSLLAARDVRLVWGLPRCQPWPLLLRAGEGGGGGGVWCNRLFARGALVHKGKLARALRASARASDLLPETHPVDEIDDVESIVRGRGADAHAGWVLKPEASSNGARVVFLPPGDAGGAGLAAAAEAMAAAEGAGGGGWVLQRYLEPALHDGRRARARGGSCSHRAPPALPPPLP